MGLVQGSENGAEAEIANLFGGVIDGDEKK
jgi:hypothetical protein